MLTNCVSTHAHRETGGQGCSSTGPISGCVEGHIVDLPNLRWWRVPFIGWGNWAANVTVSVSAGMIATEVRGDGLVSNGWGADFALELMKLWGGVCDIRRTLAPRGAAELAFFNFHPPGPAEIHLAFSAPKPPPPSTP
jgi:hypothetical protein